MITRELIKDMRGSAYPANFIEKQDDKLFYGGFLITRIVKQDRSSGSDHFYALFGGKDGNVPLAVIALTDEDSQAVAQCLHPDEPAPFTLNSLSIEKAKGLIKYCAVKEVYFDQGKLRCNAPYSDPKETTEEELLTDFLKHQKGS